jgi:hypothetical protein
MKTLKFIVPTVIHYKNGSWKIQELNDNKENNAPVGLVYTLETFDFLKQRYRNE